MTLIATHKLTSIACAVWPHLSLIELTSFVLFRVSWSAQTTLAYARSFVHGFLLARLRLLTVASSLELSRLQTAP